MGQVEKKLTLRAATGPAPLSKERADSLLSSVGNISPEVVARFLTSLAAASFEVTTDTSRDGRLTDVHARAYATVPNPGGDHRLASVVSAAGWLFVDAVRAWNQGGGRKLKADWSADTRSKEADVTFIVHVEGVRKADVAEVEGALKERLFPAFLPRALADGIALATRALDATLYAAEADSALHDAAKVAVEKAEEAMQYRAKLEKLKAERREYATALLDAEQFADLSEDARALIVPNARTEALGRALDPSMFGPHGPVIAPRLEVAEAPLTEEK